MDFSESVLIFVYYMTGSHWPTVACPAFYSPVAALLQKPVLQVHIREGLLLALTGPPYCGNHRRKAVIQTPKITRRIVRYVSQFVRKQLSHQPHYHQGDMPVKNRRPHGTRDALPTRP